MENSNTKPANTNEEQEKKVSLNYSEVSDIPLSLFKELSISKIDDMDLAVMNVINANGGITSLDRIVLGLWKETGIIHSRKKVTAKLYTMLYRKLIHSVFKKGIYSTKQYSQEELKNIRLV